jgi:DNA-binding response OmpR family regulator
MAEKNQVDHALARRKRRVLFVDDSPDALLMNALLVRSMGHEVETAANGLAAEKMAKTFRPEFIFIDLVLPDVDGCDLAKDLIKELGLAVKVYMLTGYPDDRARQRAREAGCGDFFVKPLDGAVVERLLT